MDDVVATIARDHADTLCYKVCLPAFFDFRRPTLIWMNTGIRPNACASKGSVCWSAPSVWHSHLLCRLCFSHVLQRSRSQPSHWCGAICPSAKQCQMFRWRSCSSIRVAQSYTAFLLKSRIISVNLLQLECIYFSSYFPVERCRSRTSHGSGSGRGDRVLVLNRRRRLGSRARILVEPARSTSSKHEQRAGNITKRNRVERIHATV